MSMLMNNKADREKKAFMYTFKTAKMPSSGQTGLLQDLSQRGKKITAETANSSSPSM